MSETKSPLDQAVDLFVYAPVGLAVAARDLVPTLVERGRRQINPQVGVAKMVGQLAVSQGRNQAEKVVERAWSQARMTLQQLGILPEEPAPETRCGGAASAAPGEPETTTAAREPVLTTVAPPPPATPVPMPPVFGGGPGLTLAIPDYDSLSASQVLPRLSSLSAEELEAVRAYEDEHRGRKTILNRVAQIQVT